MDIFEYSKKAFWAFVVFLVSYGLMIAALAILVARGLFRISETNANDSMTALLLSIPFVAFYIVVLLGATAGYARSQIMAERLPIRDLLQSELKKRKMSGSSIRTTVRNAAKLVESDTLLRAVTLIVAARLPILPVVDAGDRVIGVISHSDIAGRIEQLLNSEDLTSIGSRLAATTISEIMQQPPIVATSTESLSNVVERMLLNQFIRLIVVDDSASMKLSGTIDILDLVGEIYKSNGEA